MKARGSAAGRVEPTASMRVDNSVQMMAEPMVGATVENWADLKVQCLDMMLV